MLTPTPQTPHDAVLELARRYRYEADHSHHVESLAGTLFVELQSLHGLEDGDRRWLEWAAILHDIGYYVSSRSHHKHALQLILSEPLPALTRREKALVANIARYHRKAAPSLQHTAFAILDESDQERVAKLAALLRIADALDRSHGQPVQELFCETGPETIVLYAGAEHDLPEERLAIARKSDLFQQVYGRTLELRTLRPRLSLAEITLPVAVADSALPTSALP